MYMIIIELSIRYALAPNTSNDCKFKNPLLLKYNFNISMTKIQN